MLNPPYTRAQVQAASPKRPAPIDSYTHNHYRLFDALTALLTGDKPTLQHWVLLANACNMLEALQQQGRISDPENVITDCLDALARAYSRPHLRLDASGRAAVICMLDSYVLCCKEIPERAIRSAINYAYNAQQHTKIV